MRNRNCLFFARTCGVCVALIFNFLYCAFCLVCNRSVSCAQCCQCLWIVQSCSWSLCILCPVLQMSMNCPVLFVIALYLVPSVVNVYELSSLACDALFIVPSVACVYELSSLVCDRSVSCVQCCQCIWIVQSCLWPVCILCPVLPMSMDCPVSIALLIFSLTYKHKQLLNILDVYFPLNIYMCGV